MTVKELVAKLGALPGDAEVGVSNGVAEFADAVFDVLPARNLENGKSAVVLEIARNSECFPYEELE